MFDAADIMSLYAETPLHPGTGAGGGVIDLPIQRERHTDIPLIQGTSLKGVLRDAARRDAAKKKLGQPGEDQIREVFGPDVGGGDDFGGALSATDARLLLFPVRSLAGIFVWVTCPFVIDRLARDLEWAGRLTTIGTLTTGNKVANGEAWIGSNNNSPLKNQVPLMLEEDDYKVVDKSEVDIFATAVKTLFPKTTAHKPFENRLDTHLAIVSDCDFRRLVKTGTDVVTRIKLNTRKTTTGDGGNMWMEEFLPSDCFFYSLLLAMPTRKLAGSASFACGRGVLDFVKTIIVDRTIIQIGGDETVGRGWMSVSQL